MTDLRKAAEMALEALNQATGMCAERTSTRKDVDEAIKALRQALAQPEQDDEAYGYAKYLAECIWEKHYKEESPHWIPSDNTLNVLTQIDNMTCGLEKAQPNTTPDSAKHSADSAESFCKQELHNLMSVAGRMALELECLLLDTKDLSVVSKWWDTGMEALQAYRHYVWSVTHGKDGENFCDSHCVHTDHHPDCKIGKQQALDKKADNARELGLDYELSKYSDIISSGGFEPPNKVDAQPEQEPVAWMYRYDGQRGCSIGRKPPGIVSEYGIQDLVPLYTAPPKREWVGLTDEEIEDLCWTEIDRRITSFARAIEAKLKEKNHD